MSKEKGSVKINMHGISMKDYEKMTPAERKHARRSKLLLEARAKNPKTKIINKALEPLAYKKPKVRVVTEEMVTPGTEEVEDALRVAKGNLTKVCVALKIPRTLLYKVIKKSKKLQLVYLECKEERLDEAEDALHDLVTAKHFPAVRFMLVAQGRKRGWTENHKEDEAKSTGPVKINIAPFDGKGGKMTIEVGEMPRQRLVQDIMDEQFALTTGGGLNDDESEQEIENQEGEQQSV